MSTIISLENLKQTVPSVFATEASNSRTSKYVFVPTTEILENFQKEGWEVSSARQMGKSLYSTHEVRLRNGQMPKVGDCFLEAIIRNSHNGLSSLRITAGLHRLICSNGLTIPESVSESFSVRHSYLDYDMVKSFTDEFANNLTTIENSIGKMSSRVLTEGEQVGYVKSAAHVRWKEGKMPESIKIEDILNPLRDGDRGNDMWTTFNVVQEKFTRGGIGYKAGKRHTSMRELKNIVSTNKINTELWELAESYC
jgi:hypothetical protein